MLKNFFIKAIEVYRQVVSPVIGPHCRFQPTCSCYGQLAIVKHGPAKGFLLTAWRILRCNPLSKPKVDLP